MWERERVNCEELKGWMNWKGLEKINEVWSGENNLGEVVGSPVQFYLIMRQGMNWEAVGQTFHFQWKEQLRKGLQGEMDKKESFH